MHIFRHIRQARARSAGKRNARQPTTLTEMNTIQLAAAVYLAVLPSTVQILKLYDSRESRNTIYGFVAVVRYSVSVSGGVLFTFVIS